MSRFWLPLLPALLLSTAGAESSDFSYAPAQWPLLLRLSAGFPEFAGLTHPTTPLTGRPVPALTDVTRAEQVSGRMAADPYWQRYVRWDGQAVKVRYSAAELVRAAQAVKRVRPQTTVRVDTGLTRVVVNISVADTARVGRAAGVPGLVLSQHERPRLRAEITPRTLSLPEVREREQAPFGQVTLEVRLTNPLDRPVWWRYGCGGNVLVGVLTATGGEVAPASGERPGGVRFTCTAEERVAVLQPGESLTLPGVLASGLRLGDLAPGRYFWHVEESRIPFTLTP
ncbi:hypothetical protein QOL99_01365 [Deinococcus sp. MIMF12]|uniref:Uncharacterized protein n=1 Tax=Deinococcus rhizophilus TaxID=3049544 RepID=A0ABT7JCM7_9DEIO|nr:hypothetical protein [Deinococcus rhizophilus]MDL2342789.1 hypothetical protein [Deinococcus rhizophilus]